MAKVEAIRATGRVSRRLARFRLQSRPGGQGPGQGDHQPGPPDEVDVKGEEAADQGDVQHAAPHPGQDGDDPQDEAEEEQDERPEPPGFDRDRHGLLGGIGRRRVGQNHDDDGGGQELDAGDVVTVHGAYLFIIATLPFTFEAVWFID